jgi:hypothetical protein
MNVTFDQSVVERFVGQMSSDPFHRSKSWDNCHQAFSEVHSPEVLALHLGFYLASWGMYRGSSGLLQKNHLVHIGAVEILSQEKYQGLKCGPDQEVNSLSVDRILELKSALKEHYKVISFEKEKGATKNISPTDTLISKVLLGALGCVPAYDRFFIDGLKDKGMSHFKFQADSLEALFRFIKEHETDIVGCQKYIKGKNLKHYPVMKIVDMYFWQIGYEKGEK